jgi:hypothetical protein
MRNQIGSSLNGHPRRVLAGVVGALVVCMLVFAPGSLGAGQTGPPRFEPKSTYEVKEVFSTRALISERLVPEGLATKWMASYSEKVEGPPWTFVNGGELEALGGNEYTRVNIGALDNESGSGAPGSTDNEAFFLRGLKPGTSYYARFAAENADNDGKPVEDVIPFKTLPVEKPEVDVHYSPSGLYCGPTCTTFGRVGALSDSSAAFVAKIDADGSSTTYHFEYSENGGGPWHEFTSGATGTITEGEEYRWLQAGLSGLKPETKYYVRLKASNKEGETVLTEYNQGDSGGPCGFTVNLCSFFTTGPAKPSVGVVEKEPRNVTADSAFVYARVTPHGSETVWGLEYAESGSGPWLAVPGGSGTISQAVAEETPYGDGLDPSGVRLTGLKASTTYYVRATASNAGVHCEGCGSETSAPVSFTTEGAPVASVYGAHGLHGESLRLLGSVEPNSVPTSSEQAIAVEGATGGSFKLAIAGHETEELPYDASPGEVQNALGHVESVGFVLEGANRGGPYTIAFVGGEGGKAQPLIETNGSGLTGVGAKVSVVSTFAGGVSYEAHYRFQYVSEKSFAERGWGGAVESAELDAGSGGARDVGYDLPVLSEGEAYRYRLQVTSTAPGTGLVTSGEGSLTVPVAPAGAGGGVCPNEAFRVGLSAGLPDCRGYEQLTPVQKEGAQEPFHYGGSNLDSYGLAAETGGRFLFKATGTDYLTGAGAGGSPYLFSFGEGGGWSMLTGTPQPEAGIQEYQPQVYSADLTHVALAAAAFTSTAGESSEVEYKVGPVGGPYVAVTAVPRKAAFGWVAGDPSLSKLVFATTDYELLGSSTGTSSGTDLYEYTSANGLVQMNVSEPGVTIGSCGANVVHGVEDGNTEQVGLTGGPHSLSSDGSRVFFEADQGKKCGEEPSRLYMRLDGTETVDLGAYVFRAANAQGTELLLESEGGGREMVLYDTETKSVTQLPGLEAGVFVDTEHVVVAADLSAVYYGSLYRYDIAARKAERLFSASSDSELTVTPDGRYVYFRGDVGGLPGGGTVRNGIPFDSRGDGGDSGERGQVGAEAQQLYRYDNQEHVVACISCASPYDPEPTLPAFLYDSGSAHPLINGAAPLDVSVSGDGRYAFFTTPAALVKEDIDGEIGIEVTVGKENSCEERGGFENCEYGDVGHRTSPSSDIYEWRADGVDGCAQLDGCVALISGGHGGYKTLLLGTADEGRDVYIYTREQLVPRDVDTSGDVYDVRVDGVPAPLAVRPTECEANSCVASPAAPIDLTPASFTFTGVGNVAPVVPAGKPVVKKKAPPKKKHHAKKKKARSKHRGRKAGRAARDRRAR